MKTELVREFKKLRRLLQRKRHFKIQLCLRLRVNGFLVSKETVVLRRWDRWKQKFGLIKRVDKGWITTVKDLGRLRVLRLFHVGHVVQTFACLARKVFMWRQRMKDLLLRSGLRISRRYLADYVKKLHQRACRTFNAITLLHWTNQFIAKWRCCFRSPRRISTYLLRNLRSNNSYGR